MMAMTTESTYLQGVPSLPDSLCDAMERGPLTKQQCREASPRIAELKRTIRVRRQRHERLTGQSVYVEPPTVIEDDLP
jgi:hypothetical protein